MTDTTDTATEGAAEGWRDLEQQASAIDGSAPPPGQKGDNLSAAPDVDTAEVLEQIASPAFALLAPAWNVQAGECRELARAWALVIDKYFPGGMGQIGPELSAALVTLAIFAPRWSQPRKHHAVADDSAGKDDATVPPAGTADDSNPVIPDGAQRTLTPAAPLLPTAGKGKGGRRK